MDDLAIILAELISARAVGRRLGINSAEQKSQQADR